MSAPEPRSQRTIGFSTFNWWRQILPWNCQVFERVKWRNARWKRQISFALEFWGHCNAVHLCNVNLYHDVVFPNYMGELDQPIPGYSLASISNVNKAWNTRARGCVWRWRRAINFTLNLVPSVLSAFWPLTDGRQILPWNCLVFERVKWRNAKWKRQISFAENVRFHLLLNFEDIAV